MGDMLYNFINGILFVHIHILRAIGYVVYVIVFRRPDPSMRGKEIEESVDKYNRALTYSQCHSCNNTKFTTKITGAEGLFQSPTTVYVCTVCGNEQRERWNILIKSSREELEREGISHSETIDRYRYPIIGEGFEVAVSMIGCAGVLTWLVFLIVSYPF